MGNTTSGAQLVYSVPIEGTGDRDGNHTRICRAATHPSELVRGLTDRDLTNCWDLFQYGIEQSNGGLFLGTREFLPNGKRGGYHWKTYKEVERMALQLGTVLIRNALCPEKEYLDERYEKARSLRTLGVFSKNCEEWFVCEQACNAYDIAIVPLYDTLGVEAMETILDQTEMECIAMSAECIPPLLKVLPKAKHVKSVIVYAGEPNTEQKESFEAMSVQWRSWREVLRRGQEGGTLPPSPGTFESVNTLCYTSGTTGAPKGVILTQGCVLSTACAALRGPLSQEGLVVTKDDIHISYLPLAHVFERVVCSVFIGKGAAIGLYGGDTLALLDDIRELKPTLFISVPRLYIRINDKVFGGVREKSAIAQYLFHQGMAAKLANLRRDATTTHTFWDKLVFGKTRMLMGGRLRYLIVGGAPLDPLVQERIKILFCVPMLEGYGMTETMGATFLQSPVDHVVGHVGGPLPCAEYRLESVPEMNYLVTQDPPRGELCIRGPAVAEGYFRNVEETHKTWDKEGWLHTGDICVLLSRGEVKIIDRRKNIFKLAQGEYVAPEKIEGVYQQAPLVGQVFAFGYSTENFLVGIVVPDVEMSEKWAKSNGRSGWSLQKLCGDRDFMAAVKQEMEGAAVTCGLKGFEKLKDIRLYHEAFSVENDLLTPTFKLKRQQVKEKFQDKLDEMYAK